MSYRWIAYFALIALPGMAPAQEAAEPQAKVAPPRSLAEAKLLGGFYQIDLVIVEGRDLLAKLDKLVPDDAESPWEKSIPEIEPGAVPHPISRPEAIRAGVLPHPPHPVADSSDMLQRPKLLDLVLYEPGVEVLSSPRITAVARQEAVVQIGSEQPFEYLEPVGNETFRLRATEPQKLGILLGLTFIPSEDDLDTVTISPLTFEVTSLDGREPVKGIGLEVGKPIISSRSLKTTVPVKIGEVRVVPIPSGPNREAAVIFRVERAEPENESKRSR